MTDRGSRVLALSLALIGSGRAGAEDKPAGPPRVVLVETFEVSPAARDRPRIELPTAGADRVASLRFPADPSASAGSGRLRAYLASNGRGAVESPVVVDGRVIGSGLEHPEPLAAAVRRALGEPAAVALDLHLDGLGLRKTCSVKVAARSPEVAGRDLLVGLALSEASASGGVEEQVVRRFETRAVRLARSGPRTLAFSVALEPGQDPSKFRLTAFVQDRAGGRVHQAEVLPWTRSHEHPATVARRTPKRAVPRMAAGPSAFDLYMAAMTAQAQGYDPSGDDGSTTCPACGSTFIPPPVAPIFLRPGQVLISPPTVTC